MESPVKIALPAGAHDHHRRRRRGPGGHDRDAAARRRQPRPAKVRRSRTSSGTTAATCASTSRSAAARTLPGRSAGARGGRISLNRILDRMTDISDLRGASRPRRRPPLRVRADVHHAWPHRTAHRVRSGLIGPRSQPGRTIANPDCLAEKLLNMRQPTMLSGRSNSCEVREWFA